MNMELDFSWKKYMDRTYLEVTKPQLLYVLPFFLAPTQTRRRLPKATLM
jgi:hypothetical protein